MIQALLIVIPILLAACAGLLFIAKYQAERADRAVAEAASLHEAFWSVTKKAGRLQEALGKSMQIGEKANEERKELGRTPDAGLADRANGLFGGLRNGKAGQ